MAGLEILTGNEKLSILQCEAMAKEIGFDKTTFDLVGPTGRLKCKWLDAYMGMFHIIGERTFMVTKQIQYISDIHCENISIDK